MGFRPLNADHAIDEVAFGVELSRPVSLREVQDIANRHFEVRKELPAVVSQAEPPELAFSYLRPDGTQTWSLQISGNSIGVLLTRYSRWAKVWSTARQYLQFALDSIDKDCEVRAISHYVVDKFVSNDADAKGSDVLARSNLLVPYAYGLPEAWHSHFGWFCNSVENFAVLNHMNVDYRRDPVYSYENEKIDLLAFLVLTHAQHARSKNTLLVRDLLFDDFSRCDDVMNFMHDSNKEFLRTVLSEEMKVRIGLGAAK